MWAIWSEFSNLSAIKTSSRAIISQENIRIWLKNQQNNKVFMLRVQAASAVERFPSPLKICTQIDFCSFSCLPDSFYLRMSGEHGKLWHFLPLSRRWSDELALPMIRRLPKLLKSASLASRAFSQKSEVFLRNFVPLNCTLERTKLPLSQNFSINVTKLIRPARQSDSRFAH